MIQELKLWVVYGLLTVLSKCAPPLPKRMAQRFAQSAAKRHPMRYNYNRLLASWAAIRGTQRDELAAMVQSLADGPLLSVVVPVYNPQPALLAEMIESIRNQSYGNWELCLADDCSTDPAVHRMLHDYAARDAKIKVTFRETNGHISAASNSAIALATGDFIVLVDHDDIIDPDALLFVAKEIRDNPTARIIYSDQDVISVQGKRNSPLFKPDWNRLLILERNYVSRLGVYQTELVRQVGGFRLGYEGAQDHDLLLRCSEFVTDDQIRHIPKVLYSWRASRDSVAAKGNAKPYAAEAGRRAVADHLERVTGQKIPVEFGPLSHSYRPLWPVSGAPLVSIIIPTRDYLSVLKIAVDSVLEKTRYQNYEIIIVDNGSVDPATLNWLAQCPAMDSRVRVIRDDGPFNYSALNNSAVQQSRGSYIVLMNNDIQILSADWLTEMLSLAQRDRAGCIGAKLYYPDGTIQHAGVIVGMGGVAAHISSHTPADHIGTFGRLKLRQNMTVVTAACLMLSRQIYDQVGGLNETDLAVSYNDVDLCLKVNQAGYQNAWTPYAEMIHHEFHSRGRDVTPEKKARNIAERAYMFRHWNTETYRDPAYNPNLSLVQTDCSFGPPIWTL